MINFLMGLFVGALVIFACVIETHRKVYGLSLKDSWGAAWAGLRMNKQKLDELQFSPMRQEWCCCNNPQLAADVDSQLCQQCGKEVSALNTDIRKLVDESTKPLHAQIEKISAEKIEHLTSLIETYADLWDEGMVEHVGIAMPEKQKDAFKAFLLCFGKDVLQVPIQQAS